MITLDEIRERIMKEEEFETMPHVAMKVMEMAEDPDVSISELEKIISYDQVLATEILKLANSPLYAPRQPITSLKHAISYLGLAVIRSLTIMIALRSLYSSDRRKSPLWGELWKHSASSAVVSRFIALSLQEKILNAEEMFIIGLLHDFGKLVLLKFYFDEYEKLIDQLSGEKGFYELEREMLGVTHSEVGAMVLALWGLPAEIVNVVGKHHEKTDDPHVACIKLANIFCAGAGYSLSTLESELKDFTEALRILKLDEDKWKNMQDEIKETLKECEAFLGV